MKNKLNLRRWYISVIGLAILCLSATMVNAVTTLTFADNTNPIDPFPSLGTWSVIGNTLPDVFELTPVAPILNSEFRMVDPASTVGGGGHKNIFNGGEQWIFGDDINLTAVVGTEITGGASLIAGSAEPAGGVGLFLNAPFFGQDFGFLAPTVGSPAGNIYGNGTITIDITGGTMQIIYPVLEAQWSDIYFPLGLVDDNIRGDKITFDGTLSNIILNNPLAGGFNTFDFVLTAEHVITSVIEDPKGDSGFQNWTAQWNLAGSGASPDVILSPPSSTDAIAATLAGTAANDGRITQTELEDATLYNAPADAAVSSSCVGSCFAFTVTGVAGTTQIELPLSTPIPAKAVYRKLIAGAWTTFDTSTGDVIESGPGVQGDCTGVTYTAGLNEGDFCIRLTIADAGPNDADGTPATDGTVIDPGGVGVLDVIVEFKPRASQSIDDAVGCSISPASGKVKLIERADWLLLLGFIALLFFRKKMTRL